MAFVCAAPVLVSCAAPGVAAAQDAHQHDPLTGQGQASVASVLVRVALLLGTATLAGIGLLRPLGRQRTRALRTLGWGVAAGTASLCLVSVPVSGVDWRVAAGQAAVSMLLPLSLRHNSFAVGTGVVLAIVLLAESGPGTRGPEFAVFTGYLLAVTVSLGVLVTVWTAPERVRPELWRRTGSLAVTAGALVVLMSVAQVLTSGFAFDRRVYSSAFGVVLLLSVVLAVAAGVPTVLGAYGSRPVPVMARRAGGCALVAAFVAWASLAGIPRPDPLPVPGTALLRQATVDGRSVPVLVTPQRPGPNLVHLPDGGMRVGTADGPLVPATRRAGASGTWATVRLPEGAGELVVARSADRDEVSVDTGSGAGAPAGITGPDGPECASAALGAELSGSAAPGSCPADGLRPEDAGSLRGLVDFLAGRGIPGITVLGDDSPRARAAMRVVTGAAAAERIATSSAPAAGNALVVVSGWRESVAQLRAAGAAAARAPTYGGGVYLAPWLLTGPVVNSISGATVPLRFDPRGPRAIDYLRELGDRFPGEAASSAGYQAWLRGTGMSTVDPTTLYGTAQVSVMPGMDHDHGPQASWTGAGTVVPVTGALTKD